jgi:hypothetical protein
LLLDRFGTASYVSAKLALEYILFSLSGAVWGRQCFGLPSSAGAEAEVGKVFVIVFSSSSTSLFDFLDTIARELTPPATRN